MEIKLLELIVAAAAGLQYGRRLARHGLTIDDVFRTGTRAWVVLILLLAPISTAMILFKRTDLLNPEAMLAIQHGCWDLVACLAVFLGTMGLPLSPAPLKYQRAGIMAVTICAVFLLLRIEASVFAPVYDQMGSEKRAPDGSILQTLPTSCTAAALANALPLFGLRGSEFECAKAIGTTRFGTTVGDLTRGLPQLGLSGEYVAARPQDLAHANRPTLLTVWSCGARHSVLWKGVGSNGAHVIIDPLVGRIRLSTAALQGMLASSHGVQLRTAEKDQGND